MSLSHPAQPAPSNPAAPDWQAIRAMAKSFPPAAFDFVRDGLAHTVQRAASARGAGAAVPASEAVIAQPPASTRRVGNGQHITGQQLCDGLRDLARERYGMLALTVLHRWGIRSTRDFGVMVYSLIDRGEMRCSDQDRFDDFLE
ncbi:MAG: hypothetical protein Q8L55_16200, partial [Phycisphaerales bacterium]|nr:hypothetical protein [Phycisphaerales bacterium]